MKYRRLYRLFIVGLGLSLLSCAGNTGADGPDSGLGKVQPKKQITIMIRAEPTLLAAELGASGGGVVGGTDQISALLTDGLSVLTPKGLYVPRIATVMPTVANGLWKVFPDGRMETTWKLHPNVRWHDGTPFTSADLLFTLEVKRDKELPFAAKVLFNYIEGATAPDAQTITVSWNQTFVDADTLFSPSVGLPLPKHLLDEAYRGADKTGFLQLPYWNDGFVGVGPFRVREWARGAYWLVAANDDYFLGRPKLDEIKAIFVDEPSLAVANLLAGNADLLAGVSNMPLETGLDLKDRWPDGNVVLHTRAWYAYPQFIDPDLPIRATSVPFRRALFYGLDRQSLGEGFNLGLPTEVTDVVAEREDPGYDQLMAAVPHYGYDPRRAEQMLNDLGYQKGSDALFHDRSGETLKSEIRSTTNIDIRVAQAVASQWQKFGMQMDFVVIPAQRTSDREYRSTFPGFLYTSNHSTPWSLVQMHSKQTPLQENGFIGINASRYRNPEFDALIDKMQVTIPLQERYAVAAQAQRLMFDQVTLYTLYYSLVPGAVARKTLQNVDASFSGTLWNPYQWDLAV